MLVLCEAWIITVFLQCSITRVYGQSQMSVSTVSSLGFVGSPDSTGDGKELPCGEGSVPLQQPKSKNLKKLNQTVMCLINDRNFPTSPVSTQLLHHSQVIPESLVKNSDSLLGLLKRLTQMHLAQCTLTVLFDASFANSAAVETLLTFSNPIQVIFVESENDFKLVLLEATQCRSYFYIFHQPKTFLAFANDGQDMWDFQGYHIFLGRSVDDLTAFATSKKGKKTEHILGLVPDVAMREEAWAIYTNRLYWTQPVQRINTWVRDSFVQPLPLFPDKLSDLKGVTLDVITFEWEPNVLYFRSDDGEVLYPYGTEIEVVKAFAQHLNFSVEFQEPPLEELWGRQQEDGTWTGMVGILSRDEVDLAVVDLYLSAERTPFIDYSVPYDIEGSCFLSRMPAPLPRWQSLALPFRLETWLSILVGLVLSGLVLFVLARLSPHQEAPYFQSVQLCYLYTFGAHCKEPASKDPKRDATKVLVSFVWLYTILFTTAYCSNLTAFLTVTLQPSPMDTIQQLYHSGMEVSGLGNFYQKALLTATDPYLKGLAGHYKDYVYLKDMFPGVQESRAVILQNRRFLEFTIATRFTKGSGEPSMRLMKECFAPHNVAMGLQKHSPLTSRVNLVIQRMLQGGLIDRWFLESFRVARDAKKSKAKEENLSGVQEDSSKDKSISSGVIPLSIDHLQGVFFILAICHLFSFLILLVEIKIGKQRSISI
ncbi:ionotropic receptor 21a-like [Oratosquilla oratoria]|uniref:ionotropic receptor 21a-like n=1 Tax=Oratosquilla oratoria TaxID=337810 RepID=UPI003F76364D